MVMKKHYIILLAVLALISTPLTAQPEVIEIDGDFLDWDSVETFLTDPSGDISGGDVVDWGVSGESDGIASKLLPLFVLSDRCYST
jgi:hypothetical protein